MNLNTELDVSKIQNNYTLGFHLAKKFYKNLDTYIDVGVDDVSNLFEISKYFQKVVGFEPSIQFESIKNSIKEYENIKCYNLALSDRFIKKDFYIDTEEPDLSSFNKEWIESFRKKSQKELTVQTLVTVTLDSVLSTTKDTIHFIKIDAEDEDSLILQGAKKTIEKFKPIVQIENIDADGEDFLHGLGYIECHDYDHIVRSDTVDRFFTINN